MAMQSLLIIIGVLAVLLVIGVPISYSIGISSLIAILQTVSLDVSVVTGAQRIFVGMSKFSLTAIPFFILAGNLMNQGGIAKRLVDFVMAILGQTARRAARDQHRRKRPVRRDLGFCFRSGRSGRQHGGKGRRGAGL